jgi:hypothetical protein
MWNSDANFGIVPQPGQAAEIALSRQSSPGRRRQSMGPRRRRSVGNSHKIVRVVPQLNGRRVWRVEAIVAQASSRRRLTHRVV